MHIHKCTCICLCLRWRRILFICLILRIHIDACVKQSTCSCTVAQDTLRPSRLFFAGFANMVMEAAVWFGKFVGIYI